MIDKIYTHFKKSDPILYSTAIRVKPLETLKPRNNHFDSLLRSIINQQLSDRVSEILYERLLALLPNGLLKPEELLKIDDEKIRNAGISYSKIKYMKDLANKIILQEIDLYLISKFEDEKVIQELTKVKGIGRWTAEMFLMFSLARQDIFSHGDLGLRRGMEKLYNLKNPSIEKVEEISIKWSPYRTYACIILWRSLDVL